MADIRLTNAAIMVEYKNTANQRLTNAAIMVEYKNTVVNQRLTNSAIMVEYKNTIVYQRVTNSLIMVEYGTVGAVYTYAVAMPTYRGTNRGVPIPGDLFQAVVGNTAPTIVWPGLIWIEGT